MTKEKTQKCIEIMQAFVDGETIEFLAQGGYWVETDSPSWNWGDVDYRIMKEEDKR